MILIAVLVWPSGVSHAACPSPSTGSVPLAEMPESGEVVFRGSGAGHSLGMSQYGARGAALLGCSTTQILTTYYRGAAVQPTPTPRELAVWMLRSGTSATVAVDANPTRAARVKWQSRGQLVGWQQEGQTWTLRMSGTTVLLTDHTGRVRYQRAAPIRSLQMLHSGIPTTLRTFHGSSPYLVRRNKWDETHFLYNAGTLDVQQRFRNRADNGTAMDKYLYGLIEVPETWPAAALGAQAIAGRTFATKVNRVLHPNSVDQVYGGHDPTRDDPGTSWRRAVDTTSGQVLVGPNGALIDALYSASTAGSTEDRRYVWGGTTTFPHLTAVDDSEWANASSDPYRAWARTFSKQYVADRFGFDRVSDVTVAAKGTTARWTGVAITGTDDGAPVTRRFTGWDVKTRLALPSPGFVVTVR